MNELFQGSEEIIARSQIWWIFTLATNSYKLWYSTLKVVFGTLRKHFQNIITVIKLNEIDLNCYKLPIIT